MFSRTDPKYNNIVKEFSQNSHHWRRLFESNSPMRESFPVYGTNEGDVFDTFGKLCLLKVFR
jgi:hypothetical protein